MCKLSVVALFFCVDGAGLIFVSAFALIWSKTCDMTMGGGGGVGALLRSACLASCFYCNRVFNFFCCFCTLFLRNALGCVALRCLGFALQTRYFYFALLIYEDYNNEREKYNAVVPPHSHTMHPDLFARPVTFACISRSPTRRARTTASALP